MSKIVKKVEEFSPDQSHVKLQGRHVFPANAFGRVQKINLLPVLADEKNDLDKDFKKINLRLPVLKSNLAYLWEINDYNESVSISKKLADNVKDSVKVLQRDWTSLVTELFVARLALSNQGTLSGKSFKGYIEEIGLSKTTVYRWLKIAEQSKTNGQTIEEQKKNNKEEKAKTIKPNSLIDITDTKNPLLKVFLNNDHMKNNKFTEYLEKSAKFKMKYNVLVKSLIGEFFQEFSNKVA